MDAIYGLYRFLLPTLWLESIRIIFRFQYILCKCRAQARGFKLQILGDHPLKPPEFSSQFPIRPCLFSMSGSYLRPTYEIIFCAFCTNFAVHPKADLTGGDGWSKLQWVATPFSGNRTWHVLRKIWMTPFLYPCKYPALSASKTGIP